MVGETFTIRIRRDMTGSYFDDHLRMGPMQSIWRRVGLVMLIVGTALLSVAVRLSGRHTP